MKVSQEYPFNLFDDTSKGVITQLCYVLVTKYVYCYLENPCNSLQMWEKIISCRESKSGEYAIPFFFLELSTNKQFPNCLVPRFQSEGSSKTFQMKWVSSACEWKKSFSCEGLCTKTRFEKEVHDISEMGYWMVSEWKCSSSVLAFKLAHYLASRQSEHKVDP